MAVMFVALLSTDSTLRSELFDFPTSGGFHAEAFMYFLMFLVLFIGGFALSLYHVFSTRPKNMIEKSMMLLFAGVTNAIAGIAAGVHIIESSDGLWLVFPMLNILSSFTLIYILALSDESRLDDTDATRPQVIGGVVATLIIFSICHFVYDLYWAITFSICTAYATNINDVFQRVIHLKPPPKKEQSENTQDDTPISEIVLAKIYSMMTTVFRR
ncbi:MAG: hypothetical protein GY861_01350 [bacterium]|nr:hypothetical protein [bacterium]